ncbi:MAG: hypothetical protein EOO77_39345 [Oxalobacteraceae bacterium]|nr:MAG: hypothetical protein EOO77_39345 [Oxalobacteraceae bacterium]
MRWVMFASTEDPRRVRWRYQFHMIDPTSPRRQGFKFPEIKLRRRTAEEARQWCVMQFGPGLPDHLTDWRWEKDGTSFQFRYEQDAFVFRLRWC